MLSHNYVLFEKNLIIFFKNRKIVIFSKLQKNEFNNRILEKPHKILLNVTENWREELS